MSAEAKVTLVTAGSTAGTFKVVVKRGCIAQHHDRLDAGQRDALVAHPSLERPPATLSPSSSATFLTLVRQGPQALPTK